MRQICGKAVKVRRGDTVTIFARLPRGSTKDARLSLWSALDGDDFSPHVQYAILGILFDGKPSMLPSMYARLTGRKPEHTWELVADEDLTFCVMQDVDTKDEPLARTGIYHNGTFVSRARRLLQNAFRLLRRRHAPRLGYN